MNDGVEKGINIISADRAIVRSRPVNPPLAILEKRRLQPRDIRKSLRFINEEIDRLPDQYSIAAVKLIDEDIESVLDRMDKVSGRNPDLAHAAMIQAWRTRFKLYAPYQAELRKVIYEQSARVDSSLLRNQAFAAALNERWAKIPYVKEWHGIFEKTEGEAVVLDYLEGGLKRRLPDRPEKLPSPGITEKLADVVEGVGGTVQSFFNRKGDQRQVIFVEGNGVNYTIPEAARIPGECTRIQVGEDTLRLQGEYREGVFTAAEEEEFSGRKQPKLKIPSIRHVAGIRNVTVLSEDGRIYSTVSFSNQDDLKNYIEHHLGSQKSEREINPNSPQPT